MTSDGVGLTDEAVVGGTAPSTEDMLARLTSGEASQEDAEWAAAYIAQQRNAAIETMARLDLIAVVLDRPGVAVQVERNSIAASWA